MSYGSLTPVDVQVLEEVLSQFTKGSIVRVVEVGIHTGQTSRGIRDYLEAAHCEVDYWCVDNGGQSDLQPPFEGARMVVGDSAEVWHLVPQDIDVALIDGCHCGNHAILDTIHYGARVSRGGFMLFHDTAPHIQQTMRDPHGPNIKWFYNSVLFAHDLMGFPSWEWKLFKEGFDTRSNYGGMQAYQKL